MNENLFSVAIGHCLFLLVFFYTVALFHFSLHFSVFEQFRLKMVLVFFLNFTSNTTIATHPIVLLFGRPVRPANVSCCCCNAVMPTVKAVGGAGPKAGTMKRAEPRPTVSHYVGRSHLQVR